MSNGFIYVVDAHFIDKIEVKKSWTQVPVTSSAVDRGFEPRSGQTKDYKSGICCFSAKHATLRRKSKDWLAWNQDNLSEWGDMSLRGLWFQ